MFTLALAALALATAPAPAADALPRYDHVVVIVEENKDYDQIMSQTAAPNIYRMAHEYGLASSFFAEVHPSEANYVALLGGDTFNIHDDDAFYCAAGKIDDFCSNTAEPGYADHTIHADHLGRQLERAGLSWKGYYETLPEPGSLAVTASDKVFDDGTRKTALYASKHSGFMNFADVQTDPERARKIVGFDQLARDIAEDALPTFALVVPNQCNEMHGLHGARVPTDCDGARDLPGLIRRGDAYAGQLVARLQKTRAWRKGGPMAIIITFDEGAGKTREGCCGVTPQAVSNFGGGHIPTIVITNLGPRKIEDATPYNHYSLLRTLESVFGLSTYLRHAADVSAGVTAMTPLFAIHAPQAAERR